MDPKERVVGFESGRFVLIGERGMGTYILSAGDVFELDIQGQFQPVRVASGGYNGWYYVTADGQPARFALGMRARLLPFNRQLAIGL